MDIMQKRSGYTLIEILVGLAIISLLFVGGYTGYREFARRQILTNAADELKSDLNLIRQKALSGDAASACTSLGSTNSLVGYQVTFTATSYSYGPRCLTTNPAASYTIVVNLPQTVTLTTSGITGYLLFNTVSGTNLTSSATLTLTHTPTSTVKTVTILTSGVSQ